MPTRSTDLGLPAVQGCRPLRLSVLWLTGLALALAVDAPAQHAPLKGVVWTQPADFTSVHSDLSAMHTMGVEAVRTDVVQDERTLALADSLGLALFQELPIARLPAPLLRDTLMFARRLLDDVLTRSRPYQSARHFGLADASDTSAPVACAYFEALASMVRRVPGARSYYLSMFIEDDRCARAVDFVLLDAVGEEDPAQVLRRWTAQTPAGLGTLGYEATAEAHGLLHPRSLESQARHLESHLNALLGSEAVAVFVYRWRDTPENRAARCIFGLAGSTGARYPAFDVVSGIYSGRQHVFAFPRGSPPAAVFPWHIAAGWLAFGVLGLLFYSNSRYRNTVHRYFAAHSFYLESIRNGREVLRLATAVVLAAQVLAMSILAATVLTAARQHVAFGYAIGLLPTPLIASTATLLARPGALLGMLILCFAPTICVAPAVVRVLFLRMRGISLAKTYMAVVWPFWHVFPLALVAMTVPSMAPDTARRVILVLFAVWLVMACAATLRVLFDLVRLYSHRFAQIILYVCCIAVLLVAGAVLTLQWLIPHLPETLTFIWHLATRT